MLAMPFALKFMLFLIGLLVIVAAAIWIMGGESKKNSTRITIKASPAVVFRYLVESDEIRRWGAGVKTVGSFSGEETETQTRIVETGGSQETWEDKVLRFQQDQMLSIKSKKFGLVRTRVFQLEKNSLGGTDVDYRITDSVSGVERFLFPFKANIKRTTMVDEMTQLRDLVESENEPPAEYEVEPVEESTSPLAPNSDQGNNGSGSPVAGTVAGGSSSQGSSVDQSKRGYESLFGTGG